MAATSNTFEGLSNGTGITSGNSGGASGDAFDLMTLGSGATATADTSKSAHGSVSMKLATGVSAADCVAEWTSKIGTATTLFVRMYLWIGSNPGTNHRLFDLVASPNLCGAIYLTTTGKLQPVDTGGGQMAISTNSIPLSQWFRVEAKWTASTTVGQAEVRLYNSPDSTTADEIVQSTASFNTQASFNEYRFGAAGDPMPANRTVWYDDIALSTVAFLGPAGTGALAPLLKPGRTWRRRFKHRQTLPLPPLSVAGFTVDQTDDAGLTDAAVLDQSREFTDSAGLTDVAALTISPGLTDSTGLTDTSSIQLIKAIDQTDSAGLTDSALLTQSKEFTDSAGLTDAALLEQQKVITDSTGLTDTSVIQSGKTINQTDDAGLTDTTAFTQSKVQTDSAGLTDTTALSVAKVVTDSAGLTDSATVGLQKDITATDSAGLTDATTLNRTAVLTDLVGLADAVALARLLALTDSAGLTDIAEVGAGIPAITPRPDTGTTPRPTTGITVRPNGALTSRPSSGTTVRPFTGITDRP